MYNILWTLYIDLFIPALISKLLPLYAVTHVSISKYTSPLPLQSTLLSHSKRKVTPQSKTIDFSVSDSLCRTKAIMKLVSGYVFQLFPQEEKLMTLIQAITELI